MSKKQNKFDGLKMGYKEEVKSGMIKENKTKEDEDWILRHYKDINQFNKEARPWFPRQVPK